MSRLKKGFTLVEALIAMAIAATIIAVAAPAYSNARSAADTAVAKSELASTLLDAVRHSAIAGTEVVVCPQGANGQCSGQPMWESGWVAFADINGNGRRDNHETLLENHPALPERVRLRSTIGRTRVVFQPSGGNAGSNVTFTVCAPSAPQRATALILSNSGNLRAGKPTEAAAARCAYGG